MKPKEYKVDLLERSIHLEPKVKPTEAEQLARSEKPVKVSEKAEVFEWPNGKVDIMFRDRMPRRKDATIVELASFPFCRVMHSKRRVNMIISFGKAEWEIAERQMIFDHDKWFEAVRNSMQEGGAE